MVNIQSGVEIMRQAMKRAAKVATSTTIGVESSGRKAPKITGNLGSESSPETKSKAKRQPKKLKVVDSRLTEGSLLRVEDPLVSLGALCQGKILRRPSQHIKSPYVADVKLDPEFGGAEVMQTLSLESPLSIPLSLS